MKDTAYIPVTVNEGMFSSEKNVSFDFEGKKVNLIVDADDVSGGKLKVRVLEQTTSQLFIELPREPFAGSGRILVPRTMLSAE